MLGDKRCCKCGETKAMTEFPRQRSDPSGVHAYCKVCKNLYSKVFRFSPKGREAAAKRDTRAEHLAARYGMSLAEYDALVERCGGSCEICGRASEGRLFVDHCHSSEKIRGLLCRKCNLAIGYVEDNVTTLQNAIAYLTR
jgi:hypothetical protein